MTVKTLAACLVCVCRCLGPCRSEPRATSAKGEGGRRTSLRSRAVEALEGKVKKERERERKKTSRSQERGDDRTFSFVALIQQPV